MAHLQLNSYFGPYYLLKLIAVGGMAEVYLARTKGLAGFEKQLALKVIHPDYADDKSFVQMLVNEAKIAVGLNHHNIAQTFDLGRIANCCFISMEFVDGMDLFQLLKKLAEQERALPIEAAVLVVHEALCGLEYAHTKADDQGNPLKIIHRDMSPQNILVSRHGEVKIVDFGIAKAANLTTKTRAGVIKGKLVYMSPEQAWGDPVDHRTDIFSCGIVLYEALTGGSLYLEKNPVKLLEMVRKAEIRPPSSRRPEVPAEVDALVMRALSPRPADRFQTAREYASALSDWLRRAARADRDPRRGAPGYTAEELGQLVEEVLGDESGAREASPRDSGARQRRPTLGPAAAAAAAAQMARDDFAVGEHSIIFSAEDMLASNPRLPGHAEAMKAAAAPAPAAPARPLARLLLLENSDAKPFELGDEFVIGRSGDLRLGDARVSRRHARIFLVENTYSIEDLGSANGTFLNEEKVLSPTRLRGGDMIRVGPFEMRFVVEEPAPEPAQAAPPERFEHDQPTPLEPLPELPAERSPARPPAPPPAPPPLPPPLRPPPVAPSPPTPSSADATEGRSPAAHPLDGVRLAVTLGAESLSLPVGDSLPLGHSLLIGGARLAGETATLVRRGESYFVEPVAGGHAVLLNGKPVVAPTAVRLGDTLQVGPLKLQLVS